MKPSYCPECDCILGKGAKEPHNCMCCAGYIDGRADERADVVAWLKDEAQPGSEWYGYDKKSACYIERGDHVRNIPTEKLACSRCGVEIKKSYELGRCYDDQSEPDLMDTHDEAEPWDEVHGDPPEEKK